MAVEYDTKEIQGYAHMLRELHFNTGLASYVRDHAEIDIFNVGAPQSLLAIIAPSHDKVCEEVRKTGARVTETLWTSARELDDAASTYEDCEHQGAAQLGRVWPREDMEAADRSVGPVRRPPVDRTTGGPGGYGLEPAPERHLVPPRNVVPDDPMKKITDVTDKFGTTDTIMAIVKEITGTNPVEEVSQLLAGNWEEFGRCADVWNRLSLAVEDLSYYVWRGNRHLDGTWQGNASDHCYDYHHRLAFAIKGLKAPLQTLATSYRHAAIATNVRAGLVGDGIKQLLDMAIVAGLARLSPAAAAAVAAPMGVRIGKIVAGIDDIIRSLRVAFGAVANTIADTTLAIASFQTRFPVKDDYHNLVRGRS